MKHTCFIGRFNLLTRGSSKSSSESIKSFLFFEAESSVEVEGTAEHVIFLSSLVSWTD